jgi:hypothetical protein
MRKNRFIFILTFTFFLIVFIGILPLHPRVFANRSEIGFIEDVSFNQESGDYQELQTLQDLIIQGAVYFFKANAHIAVLSEKIELLDIESVTPETLQNEVEKALSYMTLASNTYQKIEKKSNIALYDQNIIAKLITFEYEKFCVKNKLFKDVFEEVKAFLKIGDVRGMYVDISDNILQIVGQLKTIKDKLTAGTIPSDQTWWELNQSCARTHFLGQYVAMIFETINQM